jgi:hypothetical protein
LPPRRPAAVAAVARTEPPAPARPSAYGVDLGGAISVDRLRLLWNSLRANEPRLLRGLRPVAQMREARGGGRPDVRLIAGPLASAEDAARLCAAILNEGRFCEPAAFSGHRLSGR